MVAMSRDDSAARDAGVVEEGELRGVVNRHDLDCPFWTSAP
jgi:hypothetical protein